MEWNWAVGDMKNKWNLFFRDTQVEQNFVVGVNHMEGNFNLDIWKFKFLELVEVQNRFVLFFIRSITYTTYGQNIKL